MVSARSRQPAVLEEPSPAGTGEFINLPTVPAALERGDFDESDSVLYGGRIVGVFGGWTSPLSRRIFSSVHRT
jgi:hypothetical protein